MRLNSALEELTEMAKMVSDMLFLAQADRPANPRKENAEPGG
ncbi:hypothetical protein ACLK19_03850 [Escherichia coli]